MIHNKGNKIKGNEKKKKNSWECHTGNPLVFTTHDGIEVYGGGSSRKGGWWLMDPVPDLAMGPDEQVHKGLPSKFSTRGLNTERWSCMSKIVQHEPKEILAIDFPDYKIPQDIGEAFWVELVANIRTNEIKTIHCMCMGGHGRTGVQLSILKYLLATEEQRKQWIDANDLIMSVRDHYCQKAVESNAQQAYVALVCGLEAGVTLPFHKGGTTTTVYPKGPVKKTVHNTAMVECHICDFMAWESTADQILKTEWCYDLSCNGKLNDVTKYVVSRDDKEMADEACLCLTCLQPISDINIVTIGHLSPNTMEIIHGEDWLRLLKAQAKLNGPGTIKGKLLRQLGGALKRHKEGENIIVVQSCLLCDITMESNNDAPDYEKGDKGFVKHVKCDYCAKKMSPHKLTMAKDINHDVCCRTCSECLNSNPKTKFCFTEHLKKEHGTILDGVSPQRWLRLTNREKLDDKNEKDDKFGNTVQPVLADDGDEHYAGYW
ncbi:MAG: hypothetical protein CL489_06660 [Acidobacteria bacterium]|nr:hypothetical protein [Acidobacteriota bacterium]